MNDQLPDRTVILVVITTLILVFSLIFSLRPNQNELQPSIEWRDSKSDTIDFTQLENYSLHNSITFASKMTL